MRSITLVVGLIGCNTALTGADGGLDARSVDAALSRDGAARDGAARDGAARDAAPPDAQLWQGAFWRTQVLETQPDPRSATLIAALRSQGGWGNRDTFQIDFSIEVLTAGPEVALRPFTPTDDHYSPDCDQDPVPVPPGGALEGETGYRCESDGDCHLIVWQPHTNTLYEMWRADIGDTFRGGCLAIWHADRCYGVQGRGLDCTSADASGFPIAPLLFTADEVAAGEIPHAIRFILPNDRIRHRTYVAPGTHATGAASGGDDALPYGARLRLRGDFPVESLPSQGARVVARALQRYGMLLADGGQIALTAQSDRSTTAKWDGLLGPRDLAALRVEDFEVMPLGPPRAWQGDCVRVEAPACP